MALFTYVPPGFPGGTERRAPGACLMLWRERLFHLGGPRARSRSVNRHGGRLVMDAHGAPRRVSRLFPAPGHLAVGGGVSGASNPHPAPPGLGLSLGCRLERGVGQGGVS